MIIVSMLAFSSEHHTVPATSVQLFIAILYLHPYNFLFSLYFYTLITQFPMLACCHWHLAASIIMYSTASQSSKLYLERRYLGKVYYCSYLDVNSCCLAIAYQGSLSG